MCLLKSKPRGRRVKRITLTEPSGSSNSTSSCFVEIVFSTTMSSRESSHVVLQTAAVCRIFASFGSSLQPQLLQDTPIMPSLRSFAGSCPPLASCASAILFYIYIYNNNNNNNNALIIIIPCSLGPGCSSTQNIQTYTNTNHLNGPVQWVRVLHSTSLISCDSIFVFA